MAMTYQHTALQLESRRTIYTHVYNKPGICIRELQRETETPMGQLTYHIEKLRKAKLITEEADDRYRCFYPPHIDTFERNALLLLRRETAHEIVTFLLKHGTTTNKQLSHALNVTPPTISWHVKRLHAAGIIQQTNTQRAGYTLTAPAHIQDILEH